MTGSHDAFVAANRFGLGPQAGELAHVSADPRAWLESQLDHSAALPKALKGLPSSSSQVAKFQRARRQKKDLKAMIRAEFIKTYMTEAGQRSLAAIHTTTPFVERLVAFWSNHFTVSVRRPILFGIVGAFEREAIRPHLTGQFSDMLLAAAQHPAMLLYLDNAQSLGPKSRAGRRSNRGLNENLARELLELHTLGVDGGYTQADVRNLAMMITGWGLARPGKDANPGSFLFRKSTHEPGDKTLLGRRYSEAGLAEGEAALRDLARHPATSRHLALKLGRHFIADDPPASAVAHLARVFRESEGNLAVVTRALIQLSEPWEQPLPKLKTPQDLVVSTLRATGFAGNTKRLVKALRLLGQPPWAAPSPAGWPDQAEYWSGPDALLKRIEFATLVADRVGDRLDPRGLSAATIGPVADLDTLRAIERAPSRADGLTLLLTSPEFQRR